MLPDNQTEPINVSTADALQLSDSVVTQALAATKKADELRTAAITQLLAEIKRAQSDLKALGYEQPVHSNGGGLKRAKLAIPEELPRTTRFADKHLADVGKAILLEYGEMHGKKIEQIAKKGGYKSKSKTFQTYLRIAFERAGGFQNIGGNVWRLNESVQPKTTVVRLS